MRELAVVEVEGAAADREGAFGEQIADPLMGQLHVRGRIALRGGATAIVTDAPTTAPPPTPSMGQAPRAVTNADTAARTTTGKKRCTVRERGCEKFLYRHQDAGCGRPLRGRPHPHT